MPAIPSLDKRPAGLLTLQIRPNHVADVLAEVRTTRARDEAAECARYDQIMVLIARAERTCGPIFDHFGPVAGE